MAKARLASFAYAASAHALCVLGAVSKQQAKHEKKACEHSRFRLQDANPFQAADRLRLCGLVLKILQGVLQGERLFVPQVPFSLSAVAPLPCRMPLPALRLESHG
jgi:hypothetical protein